MQPHTHVCTCEIRAVAVGELRTWSFAVCIPVSGTTDRQERNEVCEESSGEELA